MNKASKLAAFAVSAVLALSSVAFAACSPKTPNPEPSGGGDVAGTYTITYTTQQISGNVRHAGYVTALGGQEKNTIVLKEDGTYEYTKLLTNDPSLISTAVPASAFASESVVYAAEAVASDVLFSWQPANEGENPGTCELDFNKDGTFRFFFPAYSLEETGTWSWSNWNMSLTYSDNETIEIEMDDEHTFKFTYVAVASDMLTQTFACPSSVWGSALGVSGSYTPEGGSSQPEEELRVEHYYTGTITKQTTEGEDYQSVLHLFLLSDGTAYAEVQSDASAQKSVGSWTEENGTITVTGDDGANVTVTGDKITWEEIEGAESTDIPAEFEDADWEALIEEAQAPAASGPFVLNYVFTGTYTADGMTVTLNPAQTCVWSEEWGSLQNYGFTNVSGTEKDKLVYSKGPTGYKFLVMDHFSSPYLFAPTIKDNNIPDVTYNYAVKIIVDKASGTYTYSTESSFD